MTRLCNVVGFAVIFATCLAGAFGLTMWIVAAAAAALVLISLSTHEQHYLRYGAQANVSAQSLLLLGSTLNAATASVIAFAIGRAIGWLWGI